MKQANILVVDDEEDIREAIKDSLSEADFNVYKATTGDEALEIVKNNAINLVILDINMPGLDGFSVLRRLRQSDSIPVIMLSVRQDETDKLEAIQLGADDYLTKPFIVENLLKHVKAILQRGPRSFTKHIYVYDDGYLKIDAKNRLIFKEGREIKLAPKEYDLLILLAGNTQGIVTYDMLLRQIWGEEYADAKYILQDHINRLRKAIEQEPHKPQYIINVPKAGYRFKPNS